MSNTREEIPCRMRIPSVPAHIFANYSCPMTMCLRLPCDGHAVGGLTLDPGPGRARTPAWYPRPCGWGQAHPGDRHAWRLQCHSPGACLTGGRTPDHARARPAPCQGRTREPGGGRAVGSCGGAEGSALDPLPSLAAEAPFDLAFIDADKETYPAYLDWCLRLVRPGGLIVADNVLPQRRGRSTRCIPRRCQRPASRGADPTDARWHRRHSGRGRARAIAYVIALQEARV